MPKDKKKTIERKDWTGKTLAQIRYYQRGLKKFYAKR